MTTRIISLGLGLLFLVQTLNAQDGWLLQDGNSERTAYVDTEMSPPFEQSISIQLPRNVEGFTYAYGMIYFFHGGALGVSVGAFDPEKGKISWVKRVSSSTAANGCFPAITEDIVYASGQQAKWIYALDRQTGDSLWVHPTQSNYGRTFAIKGDLFFAQPSGYGLVCLDRLTGNKLWEYGQSSAQTVPLVDDDHAYFTSRVSDTIYALKHDGTLDWKYASESGIDDFEAFVSTGDTIFFKSRGHLVALNASDGSEYWNTKLRSDTSFISGVNALTWTPQVLVSHEWLGDWRGAFMIQGFDKKTGQMIWSHPLKDESGTPAAAFGQYLVHVNGGDLQIRNASDGEVVQEFPGENYYVWSRVIVADGMLLALRGSEIRVFEPEPTRTIPYADDPVDWQILGNPGFDQIALDVNTGSLDPVQFSINTTQGVFTGISGTCSGSGRTSINVATLPAGLYVITLHNKNWVESRRLLISR